MVGAESGGLINDSPVDILPVTDFYDENDQLFIPNFVDNAIDTNSDSIEVIPFQPLSIMRKRVFSMVSTLLED